MIVVTGATGKLGNLIAEELVSHLSPREIGVSVRDPDRAVALRRKGLRVRQGDFTQPDSLSHAFEGASQILLVSSNASAFGGDPLAQHQAAINAAKQAGVQRIVYTSQIASSSSSAFPPARDHAATELMLAASGLRWTALRHGFYASSAPFFMGREWQQGKITAPVDGKVSWTTHADLASAAVAILMGVKIFEGPTPPLTGSQALDLAGLAALAANLLRLPVVRETIPDEAASAQAQQLGVPAGAVRILLGYYKASRQGEFSQVDPTLEELIGRRPMSVAGVLAESIETAARQQASGPS